MTRYIEQVKAADVRVLQKATGEGMVVCLRRLRIAAIEIAIGKHVEDRATRKILHAIMDLQ